VTFDVITVPGERIGAKQKKSSCGWWNEGRQKKAEVLTSLVQRHEKIEREREKYIYFLKNKYIYIKSGRHP
jgi:hypothetical protein